MSPFNYTSVETVADACGVLAAHATDARVLAGGTDLMVEWRRPSAELPKVVLDISRVPELAGITESDGTITIRPLATHADLLRSDLVRKFAPLLGAAAAAIGSPQIRDRGTVGGNIMNAATCADTVPPLIALGASVTLQSQSGVRVLALADLFLEPYQTKARPDELLIDIRFPKLAPAARSSFIKLGRRNALSISRLSVAAILRLGGDGCIADARIVPGASFPTWQRVTAAEQMLVGEKPDSKLFAAAGQKVSEEMINATGRRWSTEYKEPVLAVLVRRALQECLAGLSPQSCVPARVGRAFRCAPGDVIKTRVLPVLSAARGAQRRARPAAAAEPPRPAALAAISATINGRERKLLIPASRTLLDVLRDNLGLTGTKCGCEIGECGACTVLLDGRPVNSCLVLAPQIHGREVLTVEGLAQDGKLHPLQESFLEHDAVHCGFCTPGMLLSAKALLDWNPRPTETEIRTAISGNLCRCTGYQQIVQAIESAASRPRNLAEPRKRPAPAAA
jgi:xanthine dehydrogenase iron-sulfur cluster and FAD-binding subunit A